MASILSDFGVSEMLRCSIGLRDATRDAATMEAAARDAARFLHTELVDGDGKPACALVRCYKTHLYRNLDKDLQAFARRVLPPGALPSSAMRCLTLLATVGDRPEWNDRRASKGHQAIPLPTASMVERAPMVAQLIRALGVDLETAIAPRPEIVRDLAGKNFGVFHVPEARNSPYIPDQDFVARARLRSVVGFGGALENGDLFATILFSRVAIGERSADRFRTLALDLKSRFFLFGPDQIFDPA